MLGSRKKKQKKIIGYTELSARNECRGEKIEKKRENQFLSSTKRAGNGE